MAIGIIRRPFFALLLSLSKNWASKKDKEQTRTFLQAGNCGNSLITVQGCLCPFFFLKKRKNEEKFKADRSLRASARPTPLHI
jgi:hypothetical protein